LFIGCLPFRRHCGGVVKRYCHGDAVHFRSPGWLHHVGLNHVLDVLAASDCHTLAGKRHLSHRRTLGRGEANLEKAVYVQLVDHEALSVQNGSALDLADVVVRGILGLGHTAHILGVVPVGLE
jgi:hypothetical protein